MKFTSLREVDIYVVFNRYNHSITLSNLINYYHVLKYKSYRSTFYGSSTKTELIYRCQ